MILQLKYIFWFIYFSITYHIIIIIILTDVITISSSTSVGTIVFAVNSTDHENDQLTHSLNYCIKCPFTISQCMYTTHNIFKFGKS